MLFQFNVELKLVAPGDADIGPVTTAPRSVNSMLMGTGAAEVSRHVIGTLDIGLCSSSASARNSLANVGSVIPSRYGADAHPVHENIPDVPFAQQDPVAGELTPVVALRCAWTGYIGPLTMRAEKNRTWSGSIAGQKPLRTPPIQVMP